MSDDVKLIFLNQLYYHMEISPTISLKIIKYRKNYYYSYRCKDYAELSHTNASKKVLVLEIEQSQRIVDFMYALSWTSCVGIYPNISDHLLIL